MNLALPRFRNQFHPAWFLLPVPPLLAIAIGWFNDNQSEFTGLGVRTVLITVLVLAVFCLGATGVQGGSLRLLKELRQQLPGIMLTLLVPGFFAVLDSGEAVPWAAGSHVLGCLLLCANAFGAEFEHRTFPNLLTQPISRAQIYREKLVVAAVLILIATANLGLALVPSGQFHFNLGDLLEVTGVALLALCSGPLFSLLSRSTLAGMVFTVAIPGALFLLSTLSVQLIHY